MKRPKVLVSISFFKPYGFEDRWVVWDTKDRGKAFLLVMEQYPEKDKRCINYIRHDLGFKGNNLENRKELTYATT